MERVRKLLTEKIAPDKDKNNGRPGMDLWNILVLGIIRLAANIDYCRVRDYANSHREVRGFLGLSYLMPDKIFDLQTIKDNLGLLTKISATLSLEIVLTFLNVILAPCFFKIL